MSAIPTTALCEAAVRKIWSTADPSSEQQDLFASLFHPASGLHNEGIWNNCLLAYSYLRLHEKTRRSEYKDACIKCAQSLFRLNFDREINAFRQRTQSPYWKHDSEEITALAHKPEYYASSETCPTIGNAIAVFLWGALRNQPWPESSEFDVQYKLLAEHFVSNFWDAEHTKWKRYYTRSVEIPVYYRAVDQAIAIIAMLQMIKSFNEGDGIDRSRLGQLIATTRRVLLDDFGFKTVLPSEHTSSTASPVTVTPPHGIVHYLNHKETRRFIWQDIWVTIALALCASEYDIPQLHALVADIERCYGVPGRAGLVAAIPLSQKQPPSVFVNNNALFYAALRCVERLSARSAAATSPTTATASAQHASTATFLLPLIGLAAAKKIIPPASSMIGVGILTVSDRAASGKYDDKSGPALATRLFAASSNPDKAFYYVAQTAVVPDEREQIKQVLLRWANDLEIPLVLTTGGTGFAPRDITPEATKEVLEREAPGLVHAMLSASLKITPHAMLMRPAAGIRKKSVIVNLPGSPKGAVENLEAVLAGLPHAVKLLRDVPTEHIAPQSAMGTAGEHHMHQHTHTHPHSHHHHHHHDQHKHEQHHHHHHHEQVPSGTEAAAGERVSHSPSEMTPAAKVSAPTTTTTGDSCKCGHMHVPGKDKKLADFAEFVFALLFDPQSIVQ